MLLANVESSRSCVNEHLVHFVRFLQLKYQETVASFWVYGTDLLTAVCLHLKNDIWKKTAVCKINDTNYDDR